MNSQVYKHPNINLKMDVIIKLPLSRYDPDQVRTNLYQLNQFYVGYKTKIFMDDMSKDYEELHYHHVPMHLMQNVTINKFKDFIK